MCAPSTAFGPPPWSPFTGRTLDRARELAATVGAAPSDTLETFFASAEMDMVAIGTPSGLHGEHGAAAASRGLPVLVEKPLEITTERADRLIAAAAAAGVTLGVIFQDRLKPAVRELKALVGGATLGTSIVASARVRACCDRLECSRSA